MPCDDSLVLLADLAGPSRDGAPFLRRLVRAGGRLPRPDRAEDRTPRELERYQHLTPELRALTVNLIATELFRGKRARKERESGTPTGTVRPREELTSIDLR